MKSFNDLVGSTAAHAMREDRRIRQLISRIVPADMLTHVLFIRVEAETVRITLDNSAWLSRLRFSERQIIGILSRDGFSVTRASWHVDPHQRIEPVMKRESQRTARKSPQSADIVQATADAMETGSLKNALTRMAARLRSG